MEGGGRGGRGRGAHSLATELRHLFPSPSLALRAPRSSRSLAVFPQIRFSLLRHFLPLATICLSYPWRGYSSPTRPGLPPPNPMACFEPTVVRRGSDPGSGRTGSDDPSRKELALRATSSSHLETLFKRVFRSSRHWWRGISPNNRRWRRSAGRRILRDAVRPPTIISPQLHSITVEGKPALKGQAAGSRPEEPILQGMRRVRRAGPPWDSSQGQVCPGVI